MDFSIHGTWIKENNQYYKIQNEKLRLEGECSIRILKDEFHLEQLSSVEIIDNIEEEEVTSTNSSMVEIENPDVESFNETQEEKTSLMIDFAQNIVSHSVGEYFSLEESASLAELGFLSSLELVSSEEKTFSTIASSEGNSMEWSEFPDQDKWSSLTCVKKDVSAIKRMRSNSW